MSDNKTATPLVAHSGRRIVDQWHPEDDAFWKTQGEPIAYQNLWISVPSLFCSFAIWLMWGIIAVQMSNLGFPFSQEELFSLTAIAGLSGATLRIPASFMIRLSGGRNTKFLTTVLLIIPALGTGMALQSKDTPLYVFQLMALLSGFGGGNFALSMANISSFFPKRLQGTALGINAGLGNFGVTAMQILIPIVMTAGIFGSLAGGAMELQKDSGWLFGKIAAGTQTFVQNAGFLWVVILVPVSFFAYFGMHNLRTVSPNIDRRRHAYAKILWLYFLGLLVGGLGLYLYLPAPSGLGLLNMWVALPLTMIAMLLVLKIAAFGEMKAGIARQFKIFSNQHTWSMTALYVVTFGSFIGFSMALPLSITVIFGNQHTMDPVTNEWVHNVKNPNAPSALTYAWIGPFVGALIRPVGGWISDKIGGSIVTQFISAVMVIASIYAGYVMQQAWHSATPEIYFGQFLIVFVVLFAASGIGNGSTFRTVGVIFDREQAGPVLGWTSAVAAYGSFIAPEVIKGQIKAGTPEVAMYGFAAFYAVCLVLNWWFYLRKNSAIKNP